MLCYAGEMTHGILDNFRMGTSHKNGDPYGKRVEALSQVIAAQPDL